MTATIHRHHNRTWGLDTTSDDWQAHAACRPGTGHWPEWWDLTGYNTLTPENHHAIHICQTCPVATQCEALATTTNANGVIMAGVPRYGPTITTRDYICQHCQATFSRPPVRSWLYCSPYCKQAANDRKYHARRTRAAATV